MCMYFLNRGVRFAKYEGFGPWVVAYDFVESIKSFALICAHLDESLLDQGVSECGAFAWHIERYVKMSEID